jgi:hypothetical protein
MLAALAYSLLAALLQATDTTATLPELTRRADPIAVVRIETIHRLQARIDGHLQGNVLHVAEARLERRLLGNPSEERLLLLSPPSLPHHELHDLTEGARALVFVDPVRIVKVADPLSARFDEIAGSTVPRYVLQGGAWIIEQSAEADVARVPASVIELPDELQSSVPGSKIPLESLLAWLDKELDRTTPSASAKWVTTGVLGPGGGYHIELEPDGRFHGTEEGLLTPEELARFWQAVGREHFAELPELVGKCKYPDQSFFTAWTRDRSGLHRVRIFFVPDGDLDTPQARAELARALRVWSAFPGSKRPAAKR